ncbi:MAG: hypothetical protein MHM6MM_001990 [Cercozoa sp. M6MM]
MEFFAVKVNSEEPLALPVPEEFVFHLKTVSLSTRNEADKVVLKVLSAPTELEDQDDEGVDESEIYEVCTLRSGQTEQFSLDLPLSGLDNIILIAEGDDEEKLAELSLVGHTAQDTENFPHDPETPSVAEEDELAEEEDVYDESFINNDDIELHNINDNDDDADDSDYVGGDFDEDEDEDEDEDMSLAQLDALQAQELGKHTQRLFGDAASDDEDVQEAPVTKKKDKKKETKKDKKKETKKDKENQKKRSIEQRDEDDEPAKKSRKQSADASPSEKKDKSKKDKSKKDKKWQKGPRGLEYRDLSVGDGKVLKNGRRTRVQYVGELLNGHVFDHNIEQGFSFSLGRGEVIKGWDLGLKGMRIGGRRKLRIPAALAYGSRGAGADIPPNSDLVFTIKVLSQSNK